MTRFGDIGHDADGLALGIDVGGTKMAAGLVDPRGAVVVHDTVPTPKGTDPEVEFEALLVLLDHVLSAADRPDISGVGIGAPGPMTWPEGALSPVNIPAWRGFPVRSRLASEFANSPVRLRNDGVCMAIAEHWVGAARQHPSMLGMVVSTGIGGGIVLDGRVLNGASGNAGHVGHIVVDPVGPPCPCGGRGCAEALASGPSIARLAHEAGWRPSRPELGLTGEAVTIDASLGDPIASEVMRTAGRAVGIAIASALATLNVDIVVVGGGVARSGPLLFDPLREALGDYAHLAFARDVPVVAAECGVNAGLIGAAGLIHRPDQYWGVME